MPKENFTTQELTYRDEAMGDLVYRSEVGTTVERSDDRVTVKVYVDKYQNWMETADNLWSELLQLSQWLLGLERNGLKDFAEMETLQRDEDEEKERDDAWRRDDDPYLYLYLHSTYNWVMYENQDQYMFLYEMPIKDMYELAITRQIEALDFWARDDAGMILSFLRGWYHRANGFCEEDEE